MEAQENDEAPRYSPPIHVQSPADSNGKKINEEKAASVFSPPQAAPTPALTLALNAKKTIETLQSAYLGEEISVKLFVQGMEEETGEEGKIKEKGQ